MGSLFYPSLIFLAQGEVYPFRIYLSHADCKFGFRKMEKKISKVKGEELEAD